MAYTKEEQSGLLLWNTIAQLFPESHDFFSRCFVINYCPLAFFTSNGQNITPDKLTQDERSVVECACSAHLHAYLKTLETSRVLTVGRYAFEKAQSLIKEMNLLSKIEIIYIPHPSPLNRNRMAFAPALRDALMK